MTSPKLRALGSARVVVGEVYSETRKSPKKAKRAADNSISRSKGISDEIM